MINGEVRMAILKPASQSWVPGRTGTQERPRLRFLTQNSATSHFFNYRKYADGLGHWKEEVGGRSWVRGSYPNNWHSIH
eukprot:1138770-Pelagomonas_calceolata.AAC.17